MNPRQAKAIAARVSEDPLLLSRDEGRDLVAAYFGDEIAIDRLAAPVKRIGDYLDALQEAEDG